MSDTFLTDGTTLSSFLENSRYVSTALKFPFSLVYSNGSRFHQGYLLELTVFGTFTRFNENITMDTYKA
jgi:hypothetical protein